MESSFARSAFNDVNYRPEAMQLWNFGYDYIAKEPLVLSRYGSSLKYRDKDNSPVFNLRKLSEQHMRVMMYPRANSFSHSAAHNLTTVANLMLTVTSTRRSVLVSNPDATVLFILEHEGENSIRLLSPDRTPTSLFWMLDEQSRPEEMKLGDGASLIIVREAAKVFEYSNEGLELGVPRAKHVHIPDACDVIFAVANVEAARLLCQVPQSTKVINNFNKMIMGTFSWKPKSKDAIPDNMRLNLPKGVSPSNASKITKSSTIRSRASNVVDEPTDDSSMEESDYSHGFSHTVPQPISRLNVGTGASRTLDDNLINSKSSQSQVKHRSKRHRGSHTRRKRPSLAESKSLVQDIDDTPEPTASAMTIGDPLKNNGRKTRRAKRKPHNSSKDGERLNNRE